MSAVDYFDWIPPTEEEQAEDAAMEERERLHELGLDEETDR